MNDWNYDDIPIGEYNIITEPNLITGEIKQITDIAGKISEEIVQTKADQYRNALIDLKWTPPEGPEFVPPSKLAEGFQEYWFPRAAECLFMGLPVVDLPLRDILSILALLFSQSVPKEKKDDDL